MAAQENNMICKQYDDQIKSEENVFIDFRLSQADSLMDELDTIQRYLQDIQNDISLLQTMENALDLVSENMARIHRLVQDCQCDFDSKAAAEIRHEIRDLLMVNMLIAEDTEFGCHFLFRNAIINMYSFPEGTVTLETSTIPELLDSSNLDDRQAILNYLEKTATIINRQYRRVGEVSQILLDSYRKLKNESSQLMRIYQSYDSKDKS